MEIPEQDAALYCRIGHRLTVDKNLAWSEHLDEPVCLTCLGYANEAYLASDYVAGRLLAVLLMPAGIVQMPSREEVYGS